MKNFFKTIIDWLRGVEDSVEEIWDKFEAYVHTPEQAVKALEGLIERKTHYLETQEAILAELRELRDDAAEQIAKAKAWIEDLKKIV